MSSSDVRAQKIGRFSYLFMLLIFVAVVVFKLATPLLTVLFSYLALTHLKFRKNPWIAVVLFLLLVSLIFYGFVYFINESIDALPKIINDAIPVIVESAKKYEIALPFSDAKGAHELFLESIVDELKGVARVAQLATKEFVFLIIGLVIAVSIFLNGKIDLNEGSYEIKNNLYSAMCREIACRCQTFYASFAMVIGAQLVISSINTVFTGIFVYAVDLPYPHIIVVVTFLCGLLPIVGNVISNTIICSVGITQSLRQAFICLGYLIVIHKLEYFLNSKIIGGRIKNPMWLTLIGFIVGEKIMGVPGMILAPVVLYYVKVECSKLPANS